MNNLKSYVFVFISIIISLVIVFLISIGDTSKNINVKEAYNVYLDGKLLGTIKSKKALEDYINKEQKTLKKEYNVDKIYVPNGIDIEKCISHNVKIVSEKKIYNEIKHKKGFTIKGYVATITNGKNDEIKINMLKKNLFDKSAKKVVKNFVDQRQLYNYRHNSQPEIKTTGETIEKIYIQQPVSIKQSFISTDEIIYTDTDSLTKFLLFGSSNTEKEYTVKQGDTIETVAFNNKLSEEEFLIVNPEFTSSKNLLTIGQKVNIALINPVLKITVEKHVVVDQDKPYETIEKDDSSMYRGEVKTETEGVNGTQRVTEKIKYVNGEMIQSVIVKADVLKEPVNKVVLKGTKASSYSSWSGSYVSTSGEWGWPTVTPYIIESEFKWRWGKLHEGIDIAVGKGSPIYAAKAGTVTSVNGGCPNVGSYGSRCGGGYGNYVIIDHGDGTNSIYGHMLDGFNVRQGQYVSKGQLLGGMGSSGSSQATHLHFGIYYGVPMRGGKPVNPLSLY